MSNLAVEASEGRDPTEEHRRPGAMRTLLRARDIAEWLDVSEWHVYDLVRQNLIPHVKMGRNIRFQAEAIERWLEEGGAGLEQK